MTGGAEFRIAKLLARSAFAAGRSQYRRPFRFRRFGAMVMLIVDITNLNNIAFHVRWIHKTWVSRSFGGAGFMMCRS